MTNIEKYYNKFNEEHRLQTRHGLVEFSPSMHHFQKIIAMCFASAMDQNSEF